MEKDKLIAFGISLLHNRCVEEFKRLGICNTDTSIQSMFNELDKLGYYIIIHPMLDDSGKYAYWSFEITNNKGFSFSEGFSYLTRDEASLEAIKQSLKIYESK